MSTLSTILPDYSFDIIEMSTTGDNVLDRALSKIGEKSLFTKELEVALADGRVDIVVHSLKDLPTSLPDGMAIGAILERHDPHDAVVMSRKHATNGVTSLSELSDGSVVGTSSVRRIAQLRRCFPTLKFKDVRGNLNTRLRKLDEDDIYDALVLAAAGLYRMGWGDRLSETLNGKTSMWAVGQGALAVECRDSDGATKELLQKLVHLPTELTCTAEREFMNVLNGGCSAPLAVESSILETNESSLIISLRGAVFSLDGSEMVVDTLKGSVSDYDSAKALGEKLAERIKLAGGEKILLEAKNDTEKSSS